MQIYEQLNACINFGETEIDILTGVFTFLIFCSVYIDAHLEGKKWLQLM